jgi:hypothetical protein
MAMKGNWKTTSSASSLPQSPIQVIPSLIPRHSGFLKGLVQMQHMRKQGYQDVSVNRDGAKCMRVIEWQSLAHRRVLLRLKVKCAIVIFITCKL